MKYFSTVNNQYILKFKENSNLGRHLVFSQFKVPIVTDPTVSSVLFLNEEYSKFIAYSKHDWLNAVQDIINNPEDTKQYKEYLYNKWQQNYSHQTLNVELLKKIEKLYEAS